MLKMSKVLKISILVDNPDSWIIPFAENIQKRLAKQHDANLYFNTRDIPEGNILFLLGCTSIVSHEILKKNTHNLVIHESDLPKGRGWSPVSWQVLEGKNRIPVIMFEATEEPDAGPVYLKTYIELDGTELLPEIRQKQGLKTAELVYEFVDNWTNIKGTLQVGEPTYYSIRTKEDDALDINKSIIENFNHLRIVDNERYPAWFEYRGRKYKIKIYNYD